METRSAKSSGISSGVEAGFVLAAIISYSANKSIIWMLIHGFLSWFYVIYVAIESNK